MIFLEFIILATIVVVGAIKLANQAEIIDENSKMNPAIIGIILALTTSLPELATGLTSTFLGQPQMAIGNILGSNAFNFLILAIFNILFFSKCVMSRVDKGASQLNIFSGIMYVIFLVAYFSTQNNSNIEIFGRVTLTSIAIFVTYLFAIKITSNMDNHVEEHKEVDEQAYKKAKVNFVILAIIILVASIALAKNADLIVKLTGMNASVVGAIFIGVSTSLPEFVTCYSLVKNDNFTMAATSIWGSNLFNFAILTILDIFSKTALLTQIDSSLLGLAFMGLLFVVINYIQNNVASEHKIVNVLPSIAMLGIYLYFFIF